MVRSCVCWYNSTTFDVVSVVHGSYEATTTGSAGLTGEGLRQRTCGNFSDWEFLINGHLQQFAIEKGHRHTRNSESPMKRFPEGLLGLSPTFHGTLFTSVQRWTWWKVCARLWEGHPDSEKSQSTPLRSHHSGEIPSGHQLHGWKPWTIEIDVIFPFKPPFSWGIFQPAMFDDTWGYIQVVFSFFNV